MKKIRVLLLCRHNSGRSQMAEVFMNEHADNKVYAESAGLEPENLNPLVIEIMKEIGFDISAKTANSVFEYFKEGRLYNYVITSS
jgi:arsenate reductase